MGIFDFAYEFPSTIEELDKFNGKEFEVFLFEFFKALGHNARLTDDSYDKGIDLIVEFSDNDKIKRIGIQAKRWKSKVGANEIRSMLDGKAHYSLDDVWIVTTSHLTSAAITTAMNNDIEIINRERVIKFLEELKTLENIRFREKKEKPKRFKRGSSSKKSDDEFESLRKLRIRLSKKHKLYPVYLVYNNATIEEIIAKKPKTVEDLKKINGLNDKNIKLFGADIIKTINKSKGKDVDIISELKSLRKRIVSFNKLENNSAAFDDKTLKEIAKIMPTSIEELKTVEGFKEKNIEIFGEYLVNALARIK